MNNKDYLSDILSSLKCMVKDYTVALTEASNEKLYEEYFKMFQDFSKLQRQVYELMFSKGWYVLENVLPEKRNEKYNMLNQELNDLN